MKISSSLMFGFLSFLCAASVLHEGTTWSCGSTRFVSVSTQHFIRFVTNKANDTSLVLPFGHLCVSMEQNRRRGLTKFLNTNHVVSWVIRWPALDFRDYYGIWSHSAAARTLFSQRAACILPVTQTSIDVAVAILRKYSDSGVNLKGTF